MNSKFGRAYPKSGSDSLDSGCVVGHPSITFCNRRPGLTLLDRSLPLFQAVHFAKETKKTFGPGKTYRLPSKNPPLTAQPKRTLFCWRFRTLNQRRAHLYH